MKKLLLFLLLFNDACVGSVDISRFYQESFDETRPSKTKRVIYKRFAERIHNSVINRAYFEAEIARIKMGLIEKGAASIKTGSHNVITEKQFKEFAEKSGAELAICYVFPGKTYIEISGNRVSSDNDGYGLSYSGSTIYKMFFYAPAVSDAAFKSSTNFEETYDSKKRNINERIEIITSRINERRGKN